MNGEKASDLRLAGDVALTTEDVNDMDHRLNTVNGKKKKLKDWSQDT